MIKVVYNYEGELSNLQLIKWLPSIIKIFRAGFGFNLAHLSQKKKEI